MGKTIGVLSLKGGVGKTTTVVSLGSAIADFGKKVLLIDSNFSAPNLGIHLNIIDPEVTLHHVLSRNAKVSDAIHERGNLDIIPASIFEKVNINPLELRNKISGLKKKYDVILIDSSPALNDETLAAIYASDEILVVTTADHPTLSTTMKAVKLAKQRKTPINGLILNKVHNKNFELSIEDIEKASEVPVLAVIPHDVNILKALSEFTPSTAHKPRSKGTTEYKKLAATLIGEKYKPFRMGDFFNINPRRQDINREIFYEVMFK
ncbi:hypothetical protein CMI40_02300 [Candidatus Pacearchaeota archaeon]|jgi:MinD-like ATPase involved in chromosome partitioning or flagellar assembly|nr:hypothetical protein [Candidatus Pacearchaeota archaeon]|tara:strand:- start:164 stop:955 length:792 start_codon:yes stop_codon:yes gene_type:complete